MNSSRLFPRIFKLLCFGLLFSIFFSPAFVSAAEGISVPSHQEKKELRIAATVYPVWLLLRQIAHDVPDIVSELLLPAETGCPHNYTLTPQDRRKLARADFLVMNGLGLEEFLGENPERLIKKGACLLDCSKGIDGLLMVREKSDRHEGLAESSLTSSKSPQSHSDSASRHENSRHHTHGINPHIFASPDMMAKMARSLGEQLAEHDPIHASLYLKNADKTAAELDKLASECANAGKKLGSLAFAAQHGAFDYLMRCMGLEVEAYIQSHEVQTPSAKDLLALVRLIKSHKIAAVLSEPQYPDRTARAIATEAKVPCILLDSLAIGPENPPADYYAQRIRHNIKLLEQSLAQHS